MALLRFGACLQNSPPPPFPAPNASSSSSRRLHSSPAFEDRRPHRSHSLHALVLLPLPRKSPLHPSPASKLLKRPLLVDCRAQDDNDLRRHHQEHYEKRGELFITTASKLINGSFRFLRANFLPSILSSAVLFGLASPTLGKKLFEKGLSKWATFACFLISGFTLRTEELGDVMEAWPSLLFGVVSVLFITPWVAVLILQLNLVPQELITGLALFCCVPTTLSSGVALTQAAGANTAMALSLMIISNVLGILTVPYMVSKLVARGLGISIPTALLMKGLADTLLVPLFIGKVIQSIVPGSADIINKRKEELSMLSSFFLSLVPWMQVSCGRNKLLSLDIWSFTFASSLAMTVHFLFLLLNICGMQILNSHLETKNFQKKSASWAIIITGSQKTLPIAIAVIGSLGGMLGEAGLLVLPCLVAHISQIIFDSFLVRFWIKEDLKSLGAQQQTS